MANAIELIQKYSSKAWDKTYKREAISSIFDQSSDLIKFEGAKTVKIARYEGSGLSDYARPNKGVAGVFGGDGHDTSMAVGTGYGYQQGDVNLIWEEFTLRCDRAVQLRIELMDDEETDGLAVAMATQETTRTKVIPEVDAYVFSKIAEHAGTKVAKTIALGNTLGVGAANQPIYELNAAFLALADAEVPEEDQVILCSNSFYNMLRNTPELVKTLRQTEYGENVKFNINTYEGRDLIAVPESRFKTDIQLLNGGYGWKSTSKKINFIVCSKKAITHVTKYDKVRVFNPGVVQDFDGYKVNVRIYHDVFVPENKKPAIYLCYDNSASGAGSERVLTYTYTAATKILSNVVITPNDALVKGLYASEGDLAIGSSVADDASTNKGPVVEGVALTLAADTYYLYGVENGMIVAKAAATFTIAGS